MVTDNPAARTKDISEVSIPLTDAAKAWLRDTIAEAVARALTGQATATTGAPSREAEADLLLADLRRSGRLMSEIELALLIGRSVRTIESWRRVGYGPKFLRIGRTRRTSLEAYESWLAEREFDNSAHERAEACATLGTPPDLHAANEGIRDARTQRHGRAADARPP